jgi:hypothetical protein
MPKNQVFLEKVGKAKFDAFESMSSGNHCWEVFGMQCGPRGLLKAHLIVIQAFAMEHVGGGIPYAGEQPVSCGSRREAILSLATRKPVSTGPAATDHWVMSRSNFR